VTRVYISGEKQKELTIAIIIESPKSTERILRRRYKKRGKRILELSPEEEARVKREEQDLKVLCERLDGKIFQIHVGQDSSRRTAAISFQKPNH
jgi:hypothetical protein